MILHGQHKKHGLAAARASSPQSSIVTGAPPGVALSFAIVSAILPIG